jgi:diguanylate cyclase (GGDEF)-like protein/PAS domain S-box-containing protein
MAGTVPPSHRQAENGEGLPAMRAEDPAVPNGEEGGADGDAIAEVEGRLRVVFDAAPQPMWIADAGTGAVLDVNAAAIAAFGWPRQDFLGHHVDELIVLDVGTGEVRHRTSDGGQRLVDLAHHDLTHAGRPARLTVVDDLGLRRDAEARLRAIIDDAADAILTIDGAGCIEIANPATARMFGYGVDELTGAHIDSLLGSDRDSSGQQRTRVQLGREATGRRRDGTTFPLELSVTETSVDGRTVATVVARDVTERKAFERRLAHQGTHDALTGLPNRTLFMDRVGHALAATRRTHRLMAVLFCDIDRFKVVNDSLGHTAGDALLYAVAARFRQAVRTSDTVARFGGDEFVILAEDLADEADATVVAEKLAGALREPISVGGNEIVVTSSIGIAMPEDISTPETLVRDADVAMYRAKGRGRARHERFDARLRAQALERLDIESALRRAVGLEEFLVHYQPEVDLDTDRVVGVEALVRWDHPDKGLTSPAAFLPIAEETGLIVDIGYEVFRKAGRQFKVWHDRLGALTPTMWVNVSARQLAMPELVPRLRAVTEEFLPSPAYLGIEITETDIVPDDEGVQRTMRDLTDLGVRIAIDDFGTGFASLSYLWRFPADVVKIDRTFVRRLEEEREATVLIAAMIQMAHSLGKSTVAEGVETAEQLARLKRLECDAVQGYFLGRPTAGADVVLLG